MLLGVVAAKMAPILTFFSDVCRARHVNLAIFEPIMINNVYGYEDTKMMTKIQILERLACIAFGAKTRAYWLLTYSLSRDTTHNRAKMHHCRQIQRSSE